MRCCSYFDLLQLDLEAAATLARGPKHERRGGKVLDGDADRLVQRDLIFGAASGGGAGDDLADLDHAVSAAWVELGRARRKRSEGRVALLDRHDVRTFHDRR